MDYNKLYELERRIGYSFKDKQLLIEACTHRSCNSSYNNQRLEILGDSILGSIIMKKLYIRFPDMPDGKLSRARAALVSTKPLSEVCKEHDLSQFIQMGRGATGKNYQVASIQEDFIEALMGAVFRDSGFDMGTTEDVVDILFATKLSTLTANNAAPKDNKTQLQEYLQNRRLRRPEYSLVSTEGTMENPKHTMECKTVYGVTQGVARSKKIAAQIAAQNMLWLIENR